MSLEAAIVAKLKGDAGVKALVASRIYPNVAPKGARGGAYLVYQRISTPRVRSMDGPSGLASPRLQLTCYGPTYAKAMALAEAVRLALDGYAGVTGGVTVQGVTVLDEGDIPDLAVESESIRAYGRRLDVQIWHEEAVA